MRFRNSAIFLIAVILFSAFSAFAQESEAVVVDEVVAQVNDGVLTLSRIKTEMKNVADSLIQQGKKPEEAKAEVEAKRADLIANLINEELLIQKGKEAGVEAQVDAAVNQRFLGLMKENNMKNIEALYAEMRKAGANPDELREVWRKDFTKQFVLEGEVDRKVYYSLTDKQIKDYYEKNKAKFTKPETFTLSEIFLNFAGRNEAEVREKAKGLVAQLRNGGDFAKLAVENSDRSDVQQTKGKVGKVNGKELAERNAKLAAPLKATKVGGVTDPIEVDGGIEIMRVDEYEAASTDSAFDENAVRSAMTYEKLPDARKKYMTDLRKDAYIKIAESYRALVTPVLYKDDKTTTTAATEVKKSSK